MISFRRPALFLSLVLLATAPLTSLAQEAPDEGTLGEQVTRFFERMEGDWDGEGTVRLLQNDGSIREHEFRIELDFDDQWEADTWLAHTETSYDNGYFEAADTWFSVRGDILLAGSSTYREPILVEGVSPERLVYSFDRVVYPARLHFTYTLDRVDERTLRVHVAITRNGVKVEERLWTVKK